jgi:hypothetical protein
MLAAAFSVELHLDPGAGTKDNRGTPNRTALAAEVRETNPWNGEACGSLGERSIPGFPAYV